jgi:UV DNA damage endonuclease
LIKKNKTRISMHPDQFVVLNSKKKDVVERSVKEIDYHCDVLDALCLDKSAKVQIHVGGLFNEREKSKKRFVDVYNTLSKKQKKRLVIENDDRLFSVKDCLDINKETDIPIIFDSFHHQCLNHKESFSQAFELCSKTWKTTPMVDYSSQYPNGRKGRHVYSIDMKKFSYFVKQIGNADIMLEIKDKEKSALKAFNYLKRNNYL